jgi:hypothetical protein
MAIQQYPFKGGIPSGTTAQRPSNPVIGDTYYDGTLGFLFIWEGTQWIPCSAPAAQPSITVADVGTNQPYAAPTAIVTFTEGTSGGKAAGFTALQGSFSATATSSPITLTIGGPGTSLGFNGTAYNGFGTSPQSITVNQTITSVPQAPTIGTATASTSANEITVTWTNGATGGKNISAITITPYLNGTTAETARTAATTSSTSYTFTSGQLTNNASYTFKVKAANANGTSLESAASNSATFPNFVVVEYLVIAGGGSGGTGSDDGSSEGAGGGGAGGYLTSTVGLTKSTNYTVTVGGGGAAVGTGLRLNGNAGANSVFNTVTSTGGGLGGKGTGGNGGSGGSGGGGGSGNPSGAGGARTSSPVQGNAGGNASASASAGGGGGAGAAGNNGDNNGGGARGGAGLASSITGTSVTRAGGGGGGGYANYNQPSGDGAGGSGGGGAGGNPGSGTNGTANTGSGGGGAGRQGSYMSGAGGSGVVILRYLTADGTITIGAGLTGSTATDGSYKVTTITAGSGNVSWA